VTKKEDKHYATLKQKLQTTGRIETSDVNNLLSHLLHNRVRFDGGVVSFWEIFYMILVSAIGGILNFNIY
jgi:hypothetical protein